MTSCDTPLVPRLAKQLSPWSNIAPHPDTFILAALSPSRKAHSLWFCCSWQRYDHQERSFRRHITAKKEGEHYCSIWATPQLRHCKVVLLANVRTLERVRNETVIMSFSNSRIFCCYDYLYFKVSYSTGTLQKKTSNGKNRAPAQHACMAL